MKRAPQLQPLSRQHHLGLNISHHAKACADNPEDIIKHWETLSSYIIDMKSHFQIEDDLLASALLPYQATHPDVALILDKLETQHKTLHERITDAQSSEKSELTGMQVRQLATLLYDHVRFEERELLPIAQRYLTEQQLDAIYNASPISVKRIEELR